MDQGWAVVIAAAIATAGTLVGVWIGGRIAGNAARDAANIAAASAAADRADAATARLEARDEARRDRFLGERRAAIADVLLAGDRAVDIALNRGRGGPEALKRPLPMPEGPGIDRAFAVMSILAPDLAVGSGAEYRNAVHQAVYTCVGWAGQRGGGDPAEARPMPDDVRATLEGLSLARSKLIAAAVFHLGVDSYTQDTIRKVVDEYEAKVRMDDSGDAVSQEATEPSVD